MRFARGASNRRIRNGTVRQAATRRWTRCVLGSAALLLLHTAAAHHSRSNFSDEKLTLEGTVKSFEWKNPHVYFTVEMPAESALSRTWVIETHNTIVLGRRGWTRESLAIGDEVVVSGSPDRDSNRLFIFGDWVIDKRSGERLVINGRVETDSIDVPRYTLGHVDGKPDFRGVWSMVPAPGGFGNRDIAADLPLTPEGQRAAAAFDPRAISAISCIATPSPSYISFSLLEITEQSSSGVAIRHEYDNLRRFASWGESMPDDVAPTPLGHSIAYWDGNSLVVETAHYQPHPEGHGRGIPSGSGTRTIERMTLEDDGNLLNIVLTRNDPEYLSETVTQSMTFRRTNETLIDFEECDPEVARRYTQPN